MKKILISCLSNSWGGLEMVAMEMALEFQKQEFDVVVLCYEDSVISKKILGKFQNIALLKERENLFKKIYRLREILKQHQPKKMIINRLPSLKHVTPALLGMKEIDLFCISHMLVNYHKKDLYHFLLYRRLKKIIALTEIQKKNHLEYLPLEQEKIVVIPDWVSVPENTSNQVVDLKSLFSASYRSLPLMVIASRLDPQKGQELAIEALKIAIDKQRPFLLVIIGENTIGGKDIKTLLQEKVLSMNLSEYVRFLGFVENIFPYLESADAVLVPSYEETFGRVVIESMSVGTPVIASRSGGIPDLIEDQVDGLLHEKKSAVDLELKIHQLIQHPALQNKIRINSQVKSKLFSKEIVFQKIKDLIFS